MTRNIAMSLNLPKAVSKVKGGKARVVVRCAGNKVSRCVGNLVLKGHGAKRSVAYSVPRNHRKVLKVALPATLKTLVSQARQHHGSVRVKVITRTSQPDTRTLIKRQRKLRLK